MEISVADIKREAVEILKEDEGDDTGTDWITSRRIGRTLARLRLKQVPRRGSGGSRKWQITVDELERLEETFAIKDYDADPPNINGTNGVNGANGALSDTETEELNF